MSVITWTSAKGSLGIVPEGKFYDYTFVATDSDEQPLVFSFISGELPGGLYVTRVGSLRGIPVITNSISKTQTYSFAIRATNPQGKVADRSFSITVSNSEGPQISPKPDLVGAWFDGNFLEYQFNAIDSNPQAIITWSLVEGELPDGVSFDSTGYLSGYVGIIATNTTELGYEATAIETNSTVYDALPKSTDRYFNFTVQATDGYKYDTVNVRLLIVSKGNYLTDNDITLVNNTFIRIDADNKYRPIIINKPDSLPIQISGTTFAYRFLAYDPEGEPVSWTIDQQAYSGMDELDAAITQLINGDGTGGPYSMIQNPISAGSIVVYIGDTLQIPLTDYTIVSNQLTFTSATPAITDIISVQYISSDTGFDSILFDQGASGLPIGLTINTETGWIIGKLPTQIEDTKTVQFKVTAFRTLFPTYKSDAIVFNLTVKRTVNEEIVWTTDSDLGVIDNGAVSEIAVEAYNTLGKRLEYKVIYDPYRRIPQGLKVLKSGRFTGRTSFRYFSLDGRVGWLSVESTENLVVGMNIQGVGVASGCQITAIVNSTTIEVKPAIYVAQGSILTFSNLETTEVATTTSNAISTAIDNGATTFDQLCKFTVEASAVDGSITSRKTFTVTVDPYNLAPYENVYLKSLPSEQQRKEYKELIKDTYLFPQELLYRPDDPNFGVSQSLKTLFLAGLTPGTATNFVDAIALNHYSKRINFSEVKIATAKDSNGNRVYDVLYVEAVDLETFNTQGPPLSVTLDINNNFLVGDQSYNTIYPNSFVNMQQRLEEGIGYTNKGALPRWMTSVQADGNVLGMRRVLILAYTKPDASNLIAYRLANSKKIKAGSFSFVADRYQWDNALSKYYDLTTNSFLASRDTTFDKYPNLARGDIVTTTIRSTVSKSTQIEIPDGVVVGAGWDIFGQDAESSIAANVVVSSIDGTTITLSDPITATKDAVIKFSGILSVDYAVSTPLSSIDGASLNTVTNLRLIDGVTSLVQNETIVFAKQQGFAVGLLNDGWVRADGTYVPGYLEKVIDPTITNQRGGVWSITWKNLIPMGFDQDGAGFDEPNETFQNSYFDPSDDAEISLVFVREAILGQTVKVRSGKTYPSSTLQYRTSDNAVPSYLVFEGSLSQDETTFDGGSCSCREGGYSPEGDIRGGTAFSNNRDKYIIPETLDKYIKFPKDGVFV